MEWKEKSPTKEGLYLYQSSSEWVIRIKRVAMGKWHKAQNPEELYAGDQPLNALYFGRWLGPLPEPEAAQPISKPTLEEMMLDALKEGYCDFSLRASITEGIVVFYIHAIGADRQTLDFKVSGNDLTQLHTKKQIDI